MQNIKKHSIYLTELTVLGGEQAKQWKKEIRKKKFKSRSKWRARPAVDGCAQQRGVACTLITCLCALIGFQGLETHLKRGLPKGEFSQVASSGGMTPHCESECSAKTKLSTGSSSPALATALRERKDMAFTTPLYTGEGRERRMGWERRREGGKEEEIKDTERRQKEEKERDGQRGWSGRLVVGQLVCTS